MSKAAHSELSSFAHPTGWLLCAALLIACGPSGEGRPDEQLGPLVVAPEKKEEPIDVDKAASDVGELKRALAQPHSRVSELLGSHRVTGKSSIQVREGDNVVEDLSDDVSIVIDGDGNFHATLDNSKEYGRHVFFVAGSLYLRPRFGQYHRRAPADDQEPDRTRSEIYGAVGAYFDLISSGAESSDRGAHQIAGRPARRIAVSLAAEPKTPAPGSLAQQNWRGDIIVQAVEGELSLDAETGMPLEVAVSGAVRFIREGRTFDMTVSAQHTVSEIGAVAAVEPPPPEEVVEIPPRGSEFDERAELLRGIAPPPSKAPTPQDPGGKRGSSPAGE